jgi:predicted lipoprotein with Yx(FWY)xxD motif
VFTVCQPVFFIPFQELTMSRFPILRTAAALTLGTAALIGCASTTSSTSAPGGVMARDGMLTGPNGMTLYTFDKDPAGKSVCNGPCATNWPPLAAAAGASAGGDWSVVTRDDGSRQWAYKGKPVYFWVKDQKAGDRTGDGFNGVWRLARP